MPLLDLGSSIVNFADVVTSIGANIVNILVGLNLIPH